MLIKRQPRDPAEEKLGKTSRIIARRNPLLADDMGSGKTIQAIIVYLLMYEQGLVDRLLIICPKNVVYNWAKEFNKINAKPLSGVIYHGTGRKNLQISQADIIIITYETLRNDIERFEKMKWSMIIFDEIHQIRNQNTAKSKAVMKLKADFYMGLSGTPIINSLGDMHTIMSRLNPSLLGPRSKFDSIFGNGASGWGGEREYLDNHWAYQKLREKIEGVMIRRDPAIITAGLPDYHEIVRWVSLKDTTQGKNYDELLEKGRLEYKNKMGEDTIIKVKGHILALFTRLKQQVNIDFVTKQSVKIDYIEELLDDEILTDKDSKVVIFSQYNETGLDPLEKRLQKWNPLRIDGSVSAEDRERYAEMMNDLSSPHRVLLAQIIAGGTGINLQGCNFVILLDQWWNEAIHMQAFKRIRRMSQTREQHFFRIITEDTIEDKILGIINKKNRAFKGVIEGQVDSSQFTNDELEDVLFNSGLTN